MADSELDQLAKTDRNPSQESRYQELLKQSGQSYFQGGNGTQTSSMPWNGGNSGTASTGADGQAITDALGKQQQGFNDLLSSDKQSISDYLTKYSADTGSAISSANTTFKIPQQVGTVDALNSRINDLQFNTGNTGAGGYASSDQVDAALNSRYLPAFNAAVGNLNTSENAAQQQESIALAPDVAQGQALNQYIASSMTGFGQNEAAQLTTLLGKLNAGVTLTTDQWDNINKLAQAQESYNQALDTIKQQQQYQPIAQGSTLYNPTANKIINPGVLAAGGAYGG